MEAVVLPPLDLDLLNKKKKKKVELNFKLK